MRRGLALWMGAVCWTASAQTAPAPPSSPTAGKAVTADTFASLPTVTSALLSPDGQRVAAAGRRDEASRVYVFQTEGKDTGIKSFDFGKSAIVDLTWAGSDRLLVTLTMAGMLSVFGVPALRLMQVDLRTGATTVLDAQSRGLFGGKVLFADPGGGWALVVSQDTLLDYPSVKRIDLATGAPTLIEKARPHVWDWYVDAAGVVRAGIAYEGKRWTIWYRATAADPLRPVRGKTAGTDDESVVDSLRFLADPRTGVIVTNARTGRFAAYRYDFASGAVGEAIYEHPSVDIATVVTDPLTGTVSGVSYEDDRQRTVWLDPDRRALQARIDKALPGTQNKILNTSADGNRVLVWSSGASAPGTYFLLDRRAKRFEALLQPYAKLTDTPLAAVAPVSYTARDGLKIPAYLTLPPGRAAKGLPLIVMPHGGPFARDSWRYDPYVQFLASRGYAVLQPQFRGSTGYGRAFVEQGYGQWGRKMQDDLDDGMDWLVASGQVDAKRVCIMGASYGGYAALWGAIRNPERYRCAISMAGVTDLKAQLKYDRKLFSASRYFRRWQERVRGTEDVDLDSVSPVAKAAALKVPVLIAQGEDDDNVPPTQARAMLAALGKHGVPAESVFYKGEGHGFSKPADLADFLRRTEAFLDRHNPA